MNRPRRTLHRSKQPKFRQRRPGDGLGETVFQPWNRGPSLRLSTSANIYVFMRQIGIEPVGEMTAAQMAPVVLGEQVF